MEKYTEVTSLLEKGESPHPSEKDGKRVFRLQNWMAKIPSTIPISGLSIPGTHDSCAYTSTWPFISTQNLDIKSQLYAGIRYFDFRCGAVNDEIVMVHGRATLGLKLEEVLQAMYTWLSTHQTEALIVQIKQDRVSESSTIDFADLVVKTLTANQQYWRTACTTPTLGDLRGRIQLLRRFAGPRLWGYGINVTRWRDNPATPFTIHTYFGVHLTIQDHYTSATSATMPSIVAQKGGDVADMLNRAMRDPDLTHWYINFTSAYEFNAYHQINPRQIALGAYWLWRWVEGINLRLFGSFMEMKRKKRRLGMVIMDFPELPEERLIKCVVDTNFEKSAAAGGKVVSARRWMMSLLVLLLMAATLLVALLVLVMSVDDAEFASMERKMWRLRFLPTWSCCTCILP